MRIWLCALLTIAPVTIAAPAAAQQDYSKIEMRSETLAPGVHVLFGAGGNIAVSTGPDGNALIDDQFAPLSAKIQAAVTKLSPGPVKFLINTHWHGDHTGGNENFARAGSIIIAHDNVRTRMASDQFIAAMNSKVPASPAAALPVVTFETATTLHINGEDIRAVHVPPAHTDGDSLIVFAHANVIHMGDTFFATSYPFVDLSSGGDVRGVVTAADKGLTLGNANTKYIPGHGPVSDRAGLTAYRAMVSDIIGRIVTRMAKGQNLTVILAAKPTADYDAKWGNGFIKADDFVKTVYYSLQSDPPKAK